MPALKDNVAIRTLEAGDRVTPAQIEAARRYPSCILADVAGRRGALNARIRALSPTMKVAGPAFTVEVRPGDNLMVHAALALASPGDVIVVDGKADRSSALVGGLMSAQAHAAGLAGFVIDAAVRDSEELVQGSFPVFAVGTNPNGPTKGLAGRINWPAQVGDVAVNPGDLVVGDADGVVVIAREAVQDVLDAADAKVAAEARRMRDIAAGKLDSPWLAPALRQAGVLGPDDAFPAA